MTIKRRSPKQGATTQVARCSTAVTPQSVELCSSPSDILSSPILAIRCLKDTRPPHRALLQPAALHSQRSDKRLLAAGSYILALHAFNELLGSALPPGRKRSRSLLVSRTHGQVGHIRAGQRGAKIQGSTSHPSRSFRLEQPRISVISLRPGQHGRLTTVIFSPASGSILGRPNIRRSILRKHSMRFSGRFRCSTILHANPQQSSNPRQKPNTQQYSTINLSGRNFQRPLIPADAMLYDWALTTQQSIRLGSDMFNNR